MLTRVVLGAAALAMAGCQTPLERSETLVGRADLAGSVGAISGSARLFSLHNLVTINVALSNLPEAVHSVQLHAVPDCSTPGSSSARTKLVDLPDLRTDRDGRGTISSVLAGPANEVLTALLDGSGTAIIILAPNKETEMDRGTSQIACGILRRA